MDDLQRIGKYLLLEKLEETGTGTTYRGAELVSGKIDKYVLVDVLSPRLSMDRAFVDNYLNHSLISTKLEHPNILRKVTSQHENGKLYSVFEFNEGFSLQKVLERCQTDGFPLSIDHALLVVSKLLSALAFAKGRHITHGFLVPAMIFVTHEGEIKLRGFSISTALRQLTGSPLELDSRLKNYVPHGYDFSKQERDHLDIFACGSLLYEMLTGEAYLDTGANDVDARLEEAMTAADGEAIPEKIASILRASLGVGKPGGYSDIQKMAKEMEDLLYSGEYSPTTFNLAFFMHSAFRTEMEEMGENMSKEKDRNYGVAKAVEAKAGTGSAAPRKSDVVLPGPEDFIPGGIDAPYVKPEKSSGSAGSKKPIFLGVGIGVAVAIVLGMVFFMGGSKEDDKFAAKKAELQKEGELQANEMLRQQQEKLRIENQLLMEEIQKSEQEKEELRKQKLLDDMKRVELEIARATSEKESSKKLEEEKKRLIREAAELETALAKKREDDERARKQREQLTQQAERSGTASTPSQPSGPSPAPGGNATPSGSSVANAAAPSAAEKVKINEPAPTTPQVVASRPPQPGELIDFDDPELVPPILLEAYEPQEVPSKAVKDGLVRRDQNVSMIIKVLVSEGGRVEDVAVFRNPLEGKNDYGMVDKAIKTAKKLKFSAPKKQNVPVKVWWFITVNFRSK